jgi:hypothetical protein
MYAVVTEDCMHDDDGHPMDLLANALDELEAHSLTSSYFVIHTSRNIATVRVYVDDRAAFMRAFAVPPESAALKILTVTYGGVEFVNVKEKP